VKYLTPMIMEHRLLVRAQSSLRGLSAADIVREILESTAVPVETESCSSGQA